MRLEQDPLNTLPEETEIRPEYTGEFRETLEDTADKLKELRDHLKVKLHLAGMEAKEVQSDIIDSVDGLSRRLSDYAGSLGKTMDTAEVQMHLGLMDAKKRWELTKENAQEALALVKQDKEKAKTFLGEMKLQAQLAKAETKDALHETRDELSENIKEVSKQGASALKKMNHSLSEFLKSLS